MVQLEQVRPQGFFQMEALILITLTLVHDIRPGDKKVTSLEEAAALSDFVKMKKSLLRSTLQIGAVNC